MNGSRLLLRYIWAFPATALGLALVIPACAFGASVVIIDGALEVTGGGLAYASRLPRPLRFNAITFGHVIIGLNPQLLAACRAHEHVHVRQYDKRGNDTRDSIAIIRL